MVLIKKPVAPVTKKLPGEAGPGDPGWSPVVGRRYIKWRNHASHRVRTNESLKSLAELCKEKIGVKWTWQDLTLYNWGTEDPREVNWYLYHYVGCRTETTDRNNYVFSNADMPGIIYLPAVDKGPRVTVTPSKPESEKRKASRLAKTSDHNIKTSATLNTAPCKKWAQKKTLSDEAAEKIKFSSPWVSVETMSMKKFFSKSRSERIFWYKKNMCPYRNQLIESSNKHKVPMQLIAVVILNEMIDINISDVLQDVVNDPHGSVGPAQISTYTALKNKLVDISHEVSNKKISSSKKKLLMLSYVSKRLQIMQVAIEAVARELNGLFRKMSRHATNSWPLFFGFTASKALGPDWYSCFSSFTSKFLKYGNRKIEIKGRALQVLKCTEALIAVYNSPDIVKAVKPGMPISMGGPEGDPYQNGRRHGSNARYLAYDIYQEKLFRHGGLP